MSKLTNGLLAAILILVAANLGLTLVLLNRTAPGVEEVASAQQGALSRDVALEWGERASALYNAGDHAALYALFSPEARVKISSEQLQTQLRNLYKLFGEIEDWALSNRVRLGSKGSAEYHQLTYHLRVSGNSKPATMTLSLAAENDQVDLYGLRINGSASLE